MKYRDGPAVKVHVSVFLKLIMVLILRFLMITITIKPCEQDINRQKLSNNLKRKAVEEISVFPSKLICREFKNSDINSLTLNDTSLIKRNIRNARLSVHPNIPKNITETHTDMNEMAIVTNKNESFLFVND